jgi:hypothetical protein
MEFIGRQRFKVSRIADAPLETVWDLVADGAGWKNWAGIFASALEREGTPPPNGVGSIRKLGAPPLASREEVVVWDPPFHLGYVVLSGMPVRNYRADIWLDDRSEVGGVPRTLIEWSASFDPLVPGTGHLMRATLAGIIGRFATKAAEAAQRSG